MANPYFNAVYYLTQNPDVFAAGYTVDTAWDHYAQYGANEAYAAGGTTRAPNPWFDVKYYLNNNADLIAAGITPATALDHFLNYGSKANEDRAPNATIAANPITEASLLAYAKGNADLETAFGISPDATELTEAQQNALITHFYAYGYSEDRPDAPTTVEQPDPNQGQTFTLTTGVDAIVGTAANDTINGVVSATGGESTMSLADTVDGAAGTDTFNLLVSGNVAMAGSAITNVENFFIKNLTGAATAHSFANVTGAQQIWSNASATDFAATDIQNNVAMGLQNTTKNYTATFKDGTFKAGSTATVAVNGAGTSAANSVVTVGHAGAAGTGTDLTLAVLAAGGKSYIEFANDAQKIGDLKTITVTGEGFVSVTDGAGTEFDNVATIDASGNSGGVNVTTGANNKDLTVTGSSGDDKFVLTNFNDKDKVDGGAGKDTLSIALTDATAFTKAAQVSNVEVLEVTGATAAATTLNADYFGVSSFVIGGAIGHAVTLSNLANNGTVQLNANSAAAVNLTVDIKGAIAGTNDILNLTTDKDGADLNTQAITVLANGVEAVNIASSSETGAGAFAIGTITSAQLKSVTISGVGDVSVGTISAAALTTIDASAAKGAVTISAANSTAAVTYSGAEKVDTYTASNKGDTVNGSKGADQVTLGTGADKLVYTAADQSNATAMDVIGSFDGNADLIQFAAALQTGTAVYTGTTAFSSSAGFTQIGFTDAGNTDHLQVDFDGNGTVDFVVELTGLTAADFGAANFTFA